MRHVAARHDIRDLILDAVDDLLARYGYKKMTMEDVARRVGIGKGTIYLHFPGKEELILSHIDRIAERVAARLQEIAASSAPHVARIREMLTARVLIRFDSVFHYSQSLSDLLASVRTAFLARREGYFRTEEKVFEAVLRDGVRTQALDCPDAEAASRVLVLCTNSLLPYSLTARELGRREEIETEVKQIAEFLIKALAPCPKQSPRLKR
jgi:AcrR family transcriptional regulator